MSTSNSLDHLHLLRVELARLAEVKAEHLKDPIPHIEGWTVHSTVGHTGWVARYVTQALASEPDSPPSRSAIPEPPPGEEVLAWFDESQRGLMEAVEGADPDKLRPTLIGPQPASWWTRRLAHEASMHRWDAYSAFGSPAPIDGPLARDGVEELLTVFVQNRMDFSILAGTGEVLHLHATDIDDGEWMLNLEAQTVSWEHGHGKGDAAARGPVSDLLLMLWSRIPPSRLEVFGDIEILTRWQEAANF